MASKLKKTQLGRKEQYERRLANRLSLLAERKTEPSRIEKDPLVKNLRANIEATDARLKAIAKIEQRTAELAKIKAEKAESRPKAEKAAALGESLRKAARRKARRRAKTRTRKRSPRRPRRKARKKRKRRKEKRQTG